MTKIVNDTDNAAPFNGVTRSDVPSDRVLKHALDAGVEGVIVIGIMPNGDKYFNSASADARTVLWQLERTKLYLLDVSETVDATPEHTNP